MKLVRHTISVIIATAILVTASCQKTEMHKIPTIVVTYSILGSVVKELVNGNADIIVAIPNGLDLHEWAPSARDIENINKAALLVHNGLGLEAGMERYIDSAQKNGVKVFTVSDHITVLHTETHDGYLEVEHHHDGDADPHLWTDPVTMKAVVESLVPELKNDLGIDVTASAQNFIARLDDLNKQISEKLAIIPGQNRKIVTGHQSMGYFVQRYGFEMTGVIIPSLSSQANVSAADLSNLKKAILKNSIGTIFTEQGTSPAVARAIGDETGVRVVELNTHALPADGSYFTFLNDMADTIVKALK
jgi:zinc/manganese transport system substrate-binding protein